MSILTISVLVLIVILTSVAKLNAFASLFLVSFLLAVIALPGKDIVEILKQGFGNTVAIITAASFVVPMLPAKVYSSATVVMGTVTFLCVWLASFFML